MAANVIPPYPSLDHPGPQSVYTGSKPISSPSALGGHQGHDSRSGPSAASGLGKKTRARSSDGMPVALWASQMKRGWLPSYARGQAQAQMPGRRRGCPPSTRSRSACRAATTVRGRTDRGPEAPGIRPLEARGRAEGIVARDQVAYSRGNLPFPSGRQRLEGQLLARAPGTPVLLHRRAAGHDIGEAEGHAGQAAPPPEVAPARSGGRHPRRSPSCRSRGRSRAATRPPASPPASSPDASAPGRWCHRPRPCAARSPAASSPPAAWRTRDAGSPRSGPGPT